MTVERIEEALNVLSTVDPDAREIASVDVERGLPKPRIRVPGLLFGAAHNPVIEPNAPLIEAADFWAQFRPVERVRALWWRARSDSASGHSELPSRELS